MKHNYECSYKNVLLVPLNEKDILLLRRWRNNPENSKFLKPISYITIEKQKKWYSDYLTNKDEITFSIIERECLNRVVGSVSIYNIKEDSCEIGKILVGDIEAHHKNVGYNSFVALINFIFKKFGYSSINLNVFKDNVVAYNIYKKIGFKIVDEKYHEDKIECFMKIYKEDWIENEQYN